MESDITEYDVTETVITKVITSNLGYIEDDLMENDL